MKQKLLVVIASIVTFTMLLATPCYQNIQVSCPLFPSYTLYNGPGGYDWSVVCTKTVFNGSSINYTTAVEWPTPDGWCANALVTNNVTCWYECVFTPPQGSGYNPQTNLNYKIILDVPTVNTSVPRCTACNQL